LSSSMITDGQMIILLITESVEIEMPILIKIL
jgi:hypothetical protein